MAKGLDRSVAGAVLTSLHEGNAVCSRKVDAEIKWIGGTGKKMDGSIHATAVACIYLSMPHLDGGHNCAIRAERLVNAMPKGSRVKALVAWFTRFSNIRLIRQEDGSYKGAVLKPTAKDYKDADPQTALTKPFYSVEEKDVDPAAFDDQAFAKAVAALIKRAKSDNAALGAEGLAALADLEVLKVKLPELEQARS
jgi:hypothetical protein